MAVIIVALTLASIAVQYWTYTFNDGRPSGMMRLFYLDNEGNLPTAFMFVSLLLCAILLATIGYARRGAGEPYARHWLILAALFLAIAIDEAAGIHEMTITPLQQIFNASGIFHFTWVIPAILVVIIVGLSYLRFLGHLLARFRALFMAAGAIYVGGAVGMELIAGPFAERRGMENLSYALLATAEEAIEMAGIALFAYALLAFLRDHIGAVLICIGERPATARSTSPAATRLLNRSPRWRTNSYRPARALRHDPTDS